MKDQRICLKDIDNQMIEGYKDFLPQRIFDAHMHMKLYAKLNQYDGHNGVFVQNQPTPHDYYQHMSMFFPETKKFRLNIMPSLEPELRNKANNHVP